MIIEVSSIEVFRACQMRFACIGAKAKSCLNSSLGECQAHRCTLKTEEVNVVVCKGELTIRLEKRRVSRQSLVQQLHRLQQISSPITDVALNCKEVGYSPIIVWRPHVYVAWRLYELCVNSHPVADSLDAPFQNMGDAQLLPDLTRVARISALIKVRGRATDNLQLGNSRQVRSNFILYTGGEVGILF